MKKEIPNSVVKFFNELYGVDVSEVEVSYATTCEEKEILEESYGCFVTMEKKVYVSENVKEGLQFESVLAHELNHYCQIYHNKSFTINIDYIKEKYANEIEKMNKQDREITFVAIYDKLNMEKELGFQSYYNERIEIDSRIVEALYAYLMAKDVDVLESYIPSIFACGETEWLEKAISNITVDSMRYYLKSEFNDRKLRSYMSDEEIETKKQEELNTALDEFMKEVFGA